MAEIIRTDGTSETVSLPEEGRLKFYQEIVGGYVEAVRLSESLLMLVDEEGLCKSKEPNPKAISLAGRFIVGDVILVNYPEEFD